MNYKLMKDGEVINTIVGSENFISNYCKEMGYTYEAISDEPNPEVEIESEPTEEDDTAAMLVDHEYRLTLLELGLAE